LEAPVNRACLILCAAAPFLIAAAPDSKDWKQQALAAAAPFIDRANDEWTRAIVSGNADVLSAPYAADGLFIGPDGTVTRGKQAVADMYVKRRAQVTVLRASIHSDGRAAGDADDVYEWGTASMTVRREGKSKQASGRYLTVWHRSGDRWLITRNIAF
jgi:ketosteroid isomerase-like protein